MSRIVGGVIGLMCLGIFVGGVLYLVEDVQRRMAADGPSQDIADAKLMTEHILVAPATAKYVSVKIFDSKANYRLAHVVVDAQNGFGALIRHRLCLVWREEGTMIKWEDAGAQDDCPDVPDVALTTALERANGWPQ